MVKLRAEEEREQSGKIKAYRKVNTRQKRERGRRRGGNERPRGEGGGKYLQARCSKESIGSEKIKLMGGKEPY